MDADTTRKETQSKRYPMCPWRRQRRKPRKPPSNPAGWAEGKSTPYDIAQRPNRVVVINGEQVRRYRCNAKLGLRLTFKARMFPGGVPVLLVYEGEACGASSNVRERVVLSRDSCCAAGTVPRVAAPVLAWTCKLSHVKMRLRCRRLKSGAASTAQRYARRLHRGAHGVRRGLPLSSQSMGSGNMS